MRQAKGSPGEPRCPLSSQSWTPGCWHFISHARLHGWFSFRNLGTPVVSALGERAPGSVELADAGMGGGTRGLADGDPAVSQSRFFLPPKSFFLIYRCLI